MIILPRDLTEVCGHGVGIAVGVHILKNEVGLADELVFVVGLDECFDTVPDERGDACDGELRRIDGVAQAMLDVDGVEFDGVEGIGFLHFLEGFAVDLVFEMCRGEVEALYGFEHFARGENEVYE